MKCKVVKREIEELDAGASMSAEADAHLLSCDSCAAFARERSSLRLLVGSLDRVSAPPDFDWKLKARLSEDRSERMSARGFLNRFAPGAQAIAAAACVTLLLVAVVAYRQTRPALPSSGEQSAVIMGANPKEGSNPAPGVTDSNQPSASNLNARSRSLKNSRQGVARVEAARATAPQQRIFSNDMASTGAVDVTSESYAKGTGAAPIVSVSVPSAPSTQLRFEDGQGTKRTLSPVNFGGQELIGRRDKARLIPASETGIW
ncbi:MAG TPA: hypothetical protein VJS44_09005 [Pyrinomonadaceae bacterium]|nr:hypothetical protein [Pyrinomonadaceae bacterium]